MAKIDINGTILDTQYASQAEYLLGKAGEEINDVNDLKNALEGKGLAPYERFGQVIVEGNVVTTSIRSLPLMMMVPSTSRGQRAILLLRMFTRSGMAMMTLTRGQKKQEMPSKKTILILIMGG